MPRSAPLGVHSAAFTLLLGALVTLASFGADIGLPVLAATAASLAATPADAALALSVSSPARRSGRSRSGRSRTTAGGGWCSWPRAP